MPLPSRDRHRPTLGGGAFLKACSRFYPSRPPRRPLAGGPAEPTAKCKALGHIQAGRPPPASRPLASLTDPSGIPAPSRALTWKREGGTPSLRKTDRSRAACHPPIRRPRLGKFETRDPSRRSSFTLSGGAQRRRRLPSPEALAPGVQAPLSRLPKPAEAGRGFQEAGSAFRSSVNRKPLLERPGQGSQGAVLMEPVSHHSLPHHSPSSPLPPRLPALSIPGRKGVQTSGPQP